MYKDDLSQLIGLRVASATTTRKNASPDVLEGSVLTAVQTWGKYLFFIFDDGARHMRIHWGMFGVYYLDYERPGKVPTVTIIFDEDRVIYLYSVSLRIVDGMPATAEYDPRADVMSESWDAALAMKKLKALPPDALICDALLDQTIFAGVGNAIKTEALYAQLIHPESRVAALPKKVLKDLVDETAGQSQLFLTGRRANPEERYGWVLVYRRKICERCGGKISMDFTGALQRRSHWCDVCQRLYA